MTGFILVLIAAMTLLAGSGFATPTYQTTPGAGGHTNTIGNVCVEATGLIPPHAYSGTPLGPGVQIPNADLSCAYLSNANLSGANFSDTRLRLPTQEARSERVSR